MSRQWKVKIPEMARPLRIEFPGAIYHVTSRGNCKAEIYRSDRDRRSFLRVLSDVIDRYSWICHSYCLMENHYHLLIETPLGNLSRGMRQLNGVYTQQFNHANERVGHIFQGRYKAILIERETHLLELSRYIVLNPVRAGLAGSAEGWPWSSYQKIVQPGGGRSFVYSDWILAQFGVNRPHAEAAYQKFISKGLRVQSPLAEVAKRPDILGGEDFHRRVAGKMSRVSVEVPRMKRRLSPPSLMEIKASGGENDGWMHVAVREYGYSLKEIADSEGLHYSTVSKKISAWERKSGLDSQFKT